MTFICTFISFSLNEREISLLYTRASQFLNLGERISNLISYFCKEPPNEERLRDDNYLDLNYLDLQESDIYGDSDQLKLLHNRLADEYTELSKIYDMYTTTIERWVTTD